MKIRNTYFLARNLQKISSVFILLIAICLISLLSQTHAQANLEKTFSKVSQDAKCDRKVILRQKPVEGDPWGLAFSQHSRDTKHHQKTLSPPSSSSFLPPLTPPPPPPLPLLLLRLRRGQLHMELIQGCT